MEHQEKFQPVSDFSHNWKSVFCTHCGHRIDFPEACGKRFCGICSAKRNRRVANRLRFLISVGSSSSVKNLRFLTLTLPNFADLQTGFDHLIKSFRKLRQRREFMAHTEGGAFVIEVTGKTGAWHVHLHGILQGNFWSVYRISKLWKQCSGGEIVDIRAIYGTKLAGYLTKYLTKCTVPEECMDEVETAFRGKRMFGCFGTWHDINLRYNPPVYACPSCMKCDWSIPTFCDSPIRLSPHTQ
jgi:hypothetical protein